MHTTLTALLAFAETGKGDIYHGTHFFFTQGSSWALTVGRSDFSLQENKREMTVR